MLHALMRHRRAHTHTHTHTHTHKHTHTHTHTHTHAHMHTCTHTCLHAHTHTHTILHHTMSPQVAKEASLVITSRVPVASSSDGIHQYMLQSLKPASCQGLLRSTAPNLTNSEVVEGAELCHGVPLLVRRVGDALRTGQVVLQVRILLLYFSFSVYRTNKISRRKNIVFGGCGELTPPGIYK